MQPRIEPLKPLQSEQALAADPQVHAALSASAGTGKTQVLTARVLRLLLHGAAPESILCLTFTKAGAAEMANRIGERLAAWVRMRDPELRKDLFALGEPNDPVMLGRARRLFALVLDAPGGLRIQTIHSFAQTLLSAFPAEAGIVPGFQPIEGRAEQELARSTLASLVSDAEARGDRGLIADIECLSLRIGEGDATRYLVECAAVPEAMDAFGPAAGVEARLREAMALPDGDPEQLVLDRCRDQSFDCTLLGRLLDANRQWETASGRAICANIEAWLNSAPEARASGLGKLAEKIVTKDFRPYKISPRQIAVCADYEQLVQRLATLLQEIDALRRGLALMRVLGAGIRAGQAFAAAYVRAKRSAGVADFHDLIRWTRGLLAQPGIGDWVRYKLDRRTDHILVDEAQDTNAAQWEIIDRLAEEYFSGSSEAENRHRTLFMVGDFKQAIFRFQGTDPGEFEQARSRARGNASALLAAEVESGEAYGAREFRDLSISESFRSSQPVLDVVDAVIHEVGFPNMGLKEPPQAHRAFEANRRRPGLVELWKPFETSDVEEPEEGEEGWIGETDRRYAGALAGQIKRWLRDPPLLACTGKPLSPGDIMILVRSRGEFASLIVARLFEEGVPVAGVDRLHLQEPLAVQDLLAAIGFAAQPLDDLNLANLLVSPLIGWDQEQLRTLALGRKGSLWRALRERAGERADFADAEAVLGEMLRVADYAAPSRFLEKLLTGPLQGRRKLYSRLGLAARDPIDELVNSALEFERSEVASLDRFLAWFRRGDVEIKRDASAPAEAVRVMTVHGAKGLQAPLVILADATADPAKVGGRSRTLDFPVAGVDAPVIRPRKAESVAPFDALVLREQQLELEEHWRLLYVGATRAMERLIIAGVDKGQVDNCWHRRVEGALAALGCSWEEDPDWGAVQRHSGNVPPATVRPKAVQASPAKIAIPDWATTAAPPEARPPKPLAPSAAAADRDSAPPPSEAQRAAARRGTLIHQLLERLGGVEPSLRREAALRWLQRSGDLDDRAAGEEIAGTVCAVLDDPRFAPLFGPGSLAEAPLAATLPDGRVIAGTVDRLLVTGEAVSVVDFKTGRAPPSAAEIPDTHKAQMAAYAEALKVIFPNRDIKASLLYTAGPQAFDLGG